jgi:hypothetical protein
MKSRPYLATSGYLSVHSFVLPLSVWETRGWNVQNDNSHFCFVFHEMYQRILNCKWTTLWGGVCEKWMLWKIYGPEKEQYIYIYIYIYSNIYMCVCVYICARARTLAHTHTHTHIHTQNTHRQRAKSLGAFAGHLEKMIINLFVFIRLSVPMEYP